MRYLLILSFLVINFVACKQSVTEPNAIQTVQTPSFPKNVKAVLDAHGGYDTWKSMKALIYTIKNDKGDEKQSIDLQDRREIVEGPDYTMGFDGTQYWIDADTSIKKNPIFYTNLMMYFYAMPFVISDKGINYSDTEALVFDGKTFPGFRVSYNSGIGVSPEDEYFIYYNPDSHQMEWLAYTVTYFSKEKSTKLGWIRYDDWMELEGLKLPSTMAWYKTEENKPTEERNRRTFDKIILSKNKMKDTVFSPTANARIISKDE